MNRNLFDCPADTVANCFGILERGLRKLGIDPDRPVSCMLARTATPAAVAQHREQRKARAIARRGSYLMSEHQIERMVALSAEGLRQHEIAAEIGCSQGTVAKHLGRLGYHRRPARREMAA